MDKDNSLGFLFSNTGFLFQGKTYSYKDVGSIRFAQAINTVNYVPVGKSVNQQILLIVDIKNGEEITLKERESFFRNSNNDIVNRIRDVYREISEKTISQRMCAYEDQIKNNGYFFYNGWSLYPSERVMKSNKGRFDLKNYTLLKRYGFLELVPKKPSFFQKAKRSFSSSMIGINTTRDSDVIFDILKRHFGLIWNN